MLCQILKINFGDVMKKIAYVFLATLFCSFAVLAKDYYNPTQLQQFETTGSCLGCDLTSTDINVNYGVETPFNLQGANLSGSTIEMSNDTLSNFSSVIAIESSFAGSSYSQADFKNAVLINATFQNADLSYSDFTGANVTGSDFSYANLYGSQGINFSVVASVCHAIMPDGSKGECK